MTAPAWAPGEPVHRRGCRRRVLEVLDDASTCAGDRCWCKWDVNWVGGASRNNPRRPVPRFDIPLAVQPLPDKETIR